jgi:hypothetical protein
MRDKSSKVGSEDSGRGSSCGRRTFQSFITKTKMSKCLALQFHVCIFRIYFSRMQVQHQQLPSQRPPHAKHSHASWTNMTSYNPYMLRAIIELTISLSFSFNALIALFRETLAWVMTSSISLSSRPSASCGSSSSSSSFLSSPVSMALPLPLSWE